MVAREAGLTTPHFITQFRAVFGETPVQCRTRARLERACQLLATGEEPITQICLALGLGNMGSFSRIFKKRFGCAPREYRRGGCKPWIPPEGCVGLMNLAWAQIEIPAKSSRRRDGMMLARSTSKAANADQADEHLR